MPRCGCQDSCSCLITAGDGIIVEGIGTLENPYEITSESGDLSGRVVFTDDGNIDFTSTGVGTIIDPLTVFGDALLAMKDLTDVPDTTAAEGNVLVWRTDHWAYEAPTSGGTPPSGTWGTAPLDAATYGSDSLVGRETYVDSAGKLRARPEIIPAPLVTALPTAYPVGMSVMYVGAADGANWPTAGSGVATTFKTSNNVALQYIALSSATATKAWMREGIATGWGPWVQVAGLYNGSQICTAAVTLATTAVFDITGMTLTVPVAGPDSVFMVSVNYDVNNTAATAATFVGILNVAGTALNQQAVWIPTTGVLTGGRQVMTQNYRVTGLAAGNVVFKGQASNTVAGAFRVNASHSNLTIAQIA